jgi:hypothetical protein
LQPLFQYQLCLFQYQLSLFLYQLPLSPSQLKQLLKTMLVILGPEICERR